LQEEVMTRATILAVLLFVGTGGLIARPQLALKGLKVADVFAAMSGPREDFERFMTAVDEALMADPSNAGARLLHGVGLARRSLDAIQNNDGKAAAELWAASLQELDRARALAPEDESIIGGRAAFLISASRSMPPQVPRPFMPSVVSDFEKVLRGWENRGTSTDRSVHERGELLTGLAQGLAETGDPNRARAYFQRIATDLRGTVYAERAQRWLDGRPESSDPKFFSCVGCHAR
jgi:hypothetical protein